MGLGTAWQLHQAALHPATVDGAIGLIGLSCLGMAVATGRRKGSTLAQTRWGAIVLGVLWLLGLALLTAAVMGLRAHARLSDQLDPAVEGRDLRIVGVVASMPQAGDSGVRFRFHVESARLAQSAQAAQSAPSVIGPSLAVGTQVPQAVWLGWYGGPAAFGPPTGLGAGAPVELHQRAPDLRAGDRWALTVRLKAPHGGRNPHGFDFESWLWEQGLRATGYVRATARDLPPERLQATWRHPVEQARQQVRDRILASVADPRRAGILAALVTGDQRAIDRADWDLFRATGVAHLMSISGLHVTMFAWLAVAVVGALWRRSAALCLRWPAPHAAWVAGVLLAAAYAAFSGGGVPAQRTVLMLAVVGLLRVRGHHWPAHWIWAAAAGTVVLVDPWALLQPGFWLSFVAVGVLFAGGAAGPTPEPAAAPAQRGALRSLGHRLAVLAREQWQVTLALAPLGLLLFGQVSLVGLLANLFAIPWVTLVVTPLALAGALWSPSWGLADVALQALAVPLGWLAQWPWASLWRPVPDLWAGVLAVLGGIWLILRLPPWLRLLGLPLMLPALLWQPPRPAPGDFELMAADIGQGNAVLVRTARHALLYDAGPMYSRESDAGHRVLVPLLRARGERLDMLVVSHRDSDHSGGAAAVLAQQPQARWITSVDGWREMPHLQALRPAERCEAGQSWTWDGVRFEVLHPRAEDYADAKRPNALSCVLRISSAPEAPADSGVRSVLLAGDIEQAQEAALLASGSLAPVDVLLVPHHGSKTSSSPAFLDALQPRLAVVQAGYRNRFGHPAPTVVERYRDRGVVLVRSAECGAFLWSSRDPESRRCWREEQRRYWHHRVPAAGPSPGPDG